MVQKHLHELLQQDQEPFHLQNYISDLRSRLHITKTSISSSSTKQSNTLFKKTCLFSFYDSPESDPRKSPLLSGFLSPAKNVLHIPARTAALLLEAALKIHKQSVSKKRKPAALGLIDSVLKRLGTRNQDTAVTEYLPEKTTIVSGGNSTFWSDKSLDFYGCSSSSNSTEEEEHIQVPETELETHLTSISRQENLFCSIPYNGRLSPEFLSPEASPAGRRTKEGNKYHDEQSVENDKNREEEEQFSPVSVLEPQFEDDEIHEDSDTTEIEEGSYDRECSYANVQRAKQQLLEKLRRFERLAQLDPYELDKTLFEDGDEDKDEDKDDCFVNEVMVKSGLQLDKVVGLGIKRLVSELIVEEEKRGEEEEAVIMKRVCVRLDEWKVAKPESIDMMIELDFRRELNSCWWKSNDENNAKEVATEIQIAILVELVEELLEELLIAC